jgi:hypothetical protein
MKVSGELHTSAALPRGKEPQYPLDRRFDEPQNWSGICGEENILHYRESNPGCPARSPSLYRLSCPDLVVQSGSEAKLVFYPVQLCYKCILLDYFSPSFIILPFKPLRIISDTGRAHCLLGCNKQTNSVALVRKRTIPTERPLLVGEVSANFSG